MRYEEAIVFIDGLINELENEPFERVDGSFYPKCKFCDRTNVAGHSADCKIPLGIKNFQALKALLKRMSEGCE